MNELMNETLYPIQQLFLYPKILMFANRGAQEEDSGKRTITFFLE